MEKLNKLNKTVALRLKELRKEKELTQDGVAKLLMIDTSTIAKYETGANLPSVYMLVELAKLYDCSTDYIVGLID